MTEFMDELILARSSSAELADNLATKYEVSPQEPPLAALSMSFNYATLAVELTSHYEKVWAEISTAGLSTAQIEQKRDENAQRLVLLSKSTFVWVMSALEFTMKRSIEKYPSRSSNCDQGGWRQR